MTFMDKLACGEIKQEREINEYIDAWTSGDIDGRRLHEFLGLSDQEFGSWMSQQRGLRRILADRGQDGILSK